MSSLVDRLGTKWMEVDLEQYQNNLIHISKHVGHAQLIPVVKADAYGHGAIELARCCESLGVSALAVATLEEGIALREAFIKSPILLFGAVPNSLIPDLLNHKITPTVCDPEFASELNEQAQRWGQTCPIHVYVDTGMGRMGQDTHNTLKWWERLTSLPQLSIQGLYSHLAVSDEWSEEHLSFTEQQIALFNSFCQQACISKDIQLHLANSGAVISLPHTHMQAVRPGLLSYGISPREDQKTVSGVMPIQRLCCRPLFIKNMKKGQSIGYGRTYTLQKDSNIATLPIGYADGLPRSLGNKLMVGTPDGKRHPVVGRICMDMVMVNLEDNIYPLDSEFEIMGSKSTDIYQWSSACNMIPYEILTGLGRRWTRCYIKNGNVIDILRSP